MIYLLREVSYHGHFLFEWTSLVSRLLVEIKFVPLFALPAAQITIIGVESFCVRLQLKLKNKTVKNRPGYRILSINLTL